MRRLWSRSRSGEGLRRDDRGLASESAGFRLLAATGLGCAFVSTVRFLLGAGAAIDLVGLLGGVTFVGFGGGGGGGDGVAAIWSGGVSGRSVVDSWNVRGGKFGGKGTVDRSKDAGCEESVVPAGDDDLTTAGVCSTPAEVEAPSGATVGIVGIVTGVMAGVVAGVITGVVTGANAGVVTGVIAGGSRGKAVSVGKVGVGSGGEVVDGSRSAAVAGAGADVGGSVPYRISRRRRSSAMSSGSVTCREKSTQMRSQ